MGGEHSAAALLSAVDQSVFVILHCGLKKIVALPSPGK